MERSIVYLKRLDVFSFAKVMAFWTGLFGLVIGLFYAVFFAAFGGLLGLMGGGLGLLAGMGMTMVIVLPLFFAIYGFVAGAIMAWLFNVASKYSGGVKMEFEQP